MAEQGKKIGADDQRRIIRLSAVIRSRTEIARLVGVSRFTVYKYIAGTFQDRPEGSVGTSNSFPKG